MKYETDKFENNLMSEYITLFDALRFHPIKLLEIGTAAGGSLLYFADFFCHPDSRMVGIDIHPPSITHPKIKLYRCDQNEILLLEQIAAEHQPFDIIIDDASHQAAETNRSFNALWGSVAIGGYYIIEDWAVGYWDTHRGMIEVITNLIQDTPRLSIESFNIKLQKNKAIAIFKRGHTGWQS